jgi:DnaK suppressor protein
MSLDDARLAEFREVLENMLEDLARQDEAAAGSRDTVMLDQQSVGRLSRMDALQRQAMAEATHARRAQAERRIRAALARLDAGEFGYCASCGEEIAVKRLALDPTAPLCVACAAAG